MAHVNPADDAVEVDVHRARFRRLIAANPNYFGTAPEIGLEAVLEKKGDSFYEGLSCVAYSPERDRLEATVEIRRSSGYSGGLCDTGSYEHVRFYVSYDGGTSWEDAGMVSTKVHDLPPAEDCRGALVHPLSYVVGLDYRPRRQWCFRPVLPLVKAILSWEIMPPPAQPDWTPIWGDDRSCHVRIRPRPFFLFDIADRLPKNSSDRADARPAVANSRKSFQNVTPPRARTVSDESSKVRFTPVTRNGGVIPPPEPLMPAIDQSPSTPNTKPPV